MRRNDIYATAQMVDWGELFTSERAETVYPDLSDWTVGQCEEYLRDQGDLGRSNDLRMTREDYDLSPEDYDDDVQNLVLDAMIDDYYEQFGPMMNYAYQITLDYMTTPEAAQAALIGLPVVVVLLDQEPVLALSGGGMDLSWEICEAYMRLGQAPPLAYCSLPDYGDRGSSENDKAIIRACRHTLKCVEADLKTARLTLKRIEREAVTA